jgi:hypothetical protein
MHTTADGPITMDDIRKHLTQEHRDKGLPYRELIEASGAQRSNFFEGMARRECLVQPPS